MDASKKINLCYYITGHGLGHATRSMELIRNLLDTNQFNVHTVSNVKEDIFKQYFLENGTELVDKNTNEVKYSHSLRSLDTGAVQQDVFKVDPLCTLMKYYEEIHLNRSQLIKSEVLWLRSLDISLILADATPLSSVIGSQANIKTVIVSNFTWDECYREMLSTIHKNNVCSSTETLEELERMVAQCSADTAMCTQYLQLPGAMTTGSGFPIDRIMSCPLLARKPRIAGINNNLRSSMNIDDSTKLLLLGFGGHSAKWQLEDKFLPVGWECLVLG